MKKVYLFLIFLILTTPFVGFFVQVPIFKLNKGQQGQVLSQVSIREPEVFLSEFKSLYIEYFGGKDVFLTLLAGIKYFLFEETINSERVVAGTEGWLFLGNKYDRTIDGLRGNIDLPLKSICDKFRKIREKIGSAKVVFIVVPNKATIYPEYLPKKITQSGVSPLYNKLHSLKKCVKVLDLRRNLLGVKKKMKVYQKYDSHWTLAGADVAIQALLGEMLGDVTLDNIDYEFKLNGMGDLKRIAGLFNYALSEQIPYRPLEIRYRIHDVLRPEKKIHNNVYAPADSLYEVHNQDDFLAKKVLVLRDSFFNSVQEGGFNNYFKEVTYVHWRHADFVFKNKHIQKVDFVIFMMAERFLPRLDGVLDKLWGSWNTAEGK